MRENNLSCDHSEGAADPQNKRKRAEEPAGSGGKCQKVSDAATNRVECGDAAGNSAAAAALVVQAAAVGDRQTDNACETEPAVSGAGAAVNESSPPAPLLDMLLALQSKLLQGHAEVRGAEQKKTVSNTTQ